MRVMIDPGHAPGSINRGPTGYYEYQGMWMLSNHLQTALRRCGVQADLTRKERENPSLASRGRKAKGYDVFISEHSNAHNKKTRGCEAFYSLSRPGDKKHAEALAKVASDLMQNPNRGAKTKAYSVDHQKDWMGVVRSAIAVGVPHAFLVESGFHDNPQDEAWLKQDSNLRKLAEAQAEVICGILGAKYAKEDELVEFVLVNSWADVPYAKRLMERKGCFMAWRNDKGQLVGDLSRAQKVYVCGGRVDDIPKGPEIMNLAGADAFETVANIGREIRR